MSFYDARANLYDIAFSWDITEEVVWLLARLGLDVKIILEPACGSGRMFSPFAERGVEVVGLELAETMIKHAHQRMAALNLSRSRIFRGDMTDFDLGERFDGAICPINSFGHLLTWEGASSHLACLARHLHPDRKYLVQMDLLDYENPPALAPEDNSWEMERGGVKVRTAWFGRSFELDSRLVTQVCRFEVLSGPDAGTVTEDEHVLRRWNWPEWTALIDDSPFNLAACYDGSTNERDRLLLDRSLENRHLIWHELLLPHW